MTTTPTTTEPRVARTEAPVHDPSDVVAAGRASIDALDAQIVALARRRAEVSAEIQTARRTLGGGRIAHSRELEIVAHYTESLGRPGTAVALALLELCRGRA